MWVSRLLNLCAAAMVASGRLGIFTPMYFVCARQPQQVRLNGTLAGTPLRWVRHHRDRIPRPVPVGDNAPFLHLAPPPSRRIHADVTMRVTRARPRGWCTDTSLLAPPGWSCARATAPFFETLPSRAPSMIPGSWYPTSPECGEGRVPRIRAAPPPAALRSHTHNPTLEVRVEAVPDAAPCTCFVVNRDANESSDPARLSGLDGEDALPAVRLLPRRDDGGEVPLHRLGRGYIHCNVPVELLAYRISLNMRQIHPRRRAEQ